LSQPSGCALASRAGDRRAGGLAPGARRAGDRVETWAGSHYGEA